MGGNIAPIKMGGAQDAWRSRLSTMTSSTPGGSLLKVRRDPVYRFIYCCEVFGKQCLRLVHAKNRSPTRDLA